MHLIFSRDKWISKCFDFPFDDSALSKTPFSPFDTPKNTSMLSFALALKHERALVYPHYILLAKALKIERVDKSKVNLNCFLWSAQYNKIHLFIRSNSDNSSLLSSLSCDFSPLSTRSMLNRRQLSDNHPHFIVHNGIFLDFISVTEKEHQKR